MTAPDRTEELVLEMLGRRAGGDVPSELLGRTFLALAATPQAGVAGRHSPRAARRTRREPLLVAGLIVGAVALVAVMLAAGPIVTAPRDGGPDIATGASVAPADSAGATAAVASPSDSSRTAPTTGASPSPALATGSIAIVTLEGNKLRVRSLPTTDDTKSKKYTPTLPAGTRLLVVGGPVVADKMTWYQVQTDGDLIDLFGWVSTGKEGETWMEPRAPHCPEHVDAATVATLTRIEFLACFGDARVKVHAKVADLWGPREAGPSCGWIRVREGTECSVDNRWLAFPDAAVTLVTDHGNLHEVTLALPPDYAAALLRLPRQATSLLTISMDAPEAAACRIRDRASGRDLVTADHAVTRCRLQFVIQEAVLDSGIAASGSPVP